MSRITQKIVSVFLMIAIILSAAPISVQADQSTMLKKVNVLKGKQPTTNSTYGGIKNKEAATDGVTNTSQNDSTNTEISAGAETGGEKNGYDGWKPVYLQYDFGKSVPVEEIRIYRNSFATAVTTFKKVKVELSQTDDFAKSEVVFAEADVVETLPTKAKPQILTFKTPKQARYIRVWGQGQYIQNHVGTWKGYSNAVRFHEIEVIASVPEEGGNDTPGLPQEELYNISKGKLPYVYGLTPSDIENISDDKWDNYAVHNSHGNRWLQFEYKNQYQIKKVEFKLEPGEYESVKISISNDPTRKNHSQYEEVIFQQRKYKQGEEKKVITLKEPARGKVIRFLVNKKENEPTKYSEIAIWATTPLANEEKPEYQAPQSKYNTLVWFDEFNGNSIDEEKWNIIDGMANHGAIYNRNAVSIVGEGENKFLSIRSKNYDTTEALKTAVGYDAYDDTPLRSHVTWSSGRLESKNKFSFQYGRMATRAKVNDSQGIWPAIWMLCQDETGHDEIDVLEYLGQDAHGAWTTNHYGIWGKNKASQGREKMNYEAWSQDFHVYEVEWDPQNIIWYIDGQEVFRTSNKYLDALHTRPMFPILETQVGDGWVGMVDFSKQETKQDSEFLIDWIRVYQSEDQPVVRFDDLESITEGKKNEYRIPIQKASDGLMLLTDGNNSYENKNNFFYGGQPRYEKNRMAVKEDATEEQYIIYEVPGVKDVHLTAYYQTLPDKRTYRHHLDAGYSGHSIRETTLNGPEDLNFAIYTSTNGDSYRPFFRTQVVDNFIEVHPAYARTTFDAYDLPKDTRFVKIVFPKYKGKKYRKGNGHELEVKNTDIQLAKVTFLQTPQKEDDTPSQPQGENEHLKVFPSLREYKVEKGKFDKSALNRMVIVDNDLSRKNGKVKEVVQLVNQEFAAYGIPSSQTMPILFAPKTEAKDGDIVVELKGSIEGIAPAEGFTIHVDGKITVEAKNSNGVMYALRTIMQYMQLHNAMPYGKIKDYPDTDERALHLDMGRKYFTPDWIKKTIRELSFMRVNAIQLHFSEHEGYRLESETYPNLMSEDYITKEEMRGIIAEAKKYGVEIIPSFDNPGHLRAALRNYPQFQISKRNGFKDTGAIDINNDEARQFIKNIFKEYAELFADSNYFHIGADEFINFNRFYDYPSMAEFGRKHVGPNATGLDGYMAYINEIAEYVHGLGFRPRIWNDGVYRSNIRYSVKLHDYIQVGYWTQWDRNMPSVQKLLENNHELINVNDTMYYVLSNGNAYATKPNPEKIYREIDVLKFPDRAGHRPPRDKVKGLTYAIWCDVPSKETEDEITEGMYYSLRAMAEKAWAGKQDKGEYNKFETILNTLKGILNPNKPMPEAQDITYPVNTVEIQFKHVANTGQVLGNTEVRVGQKGKAYQYQAPTFKEFDYLDSSESLSGTFTENKVITLKYEKTTQRKALEKVIADKLEEANFVAETYTEYKEAMTRAEELLSDAALTDVKITKAISDIRAAEAKLVRKVFEELYNKLKNPKPQSEYTSASYRPYITAVNRLKEKIKGKDVEDTKLAEFNGELAQAEAGLRPIGNQVEISVTSSLGTYYDSKTGINHNFAKLFDGDKDSFAWTNREQRVEDHFTFTFSAPVNVTRFRLQYPTNVGKDFLAGAKLEGQQDNQWIELGDIAGAGEQDIAVDNKKVSAIRIRLTQGSEFWAKLGEVIITYSKPKPSEPEYRIAMKKAIDEALAVKETVKYKNATESKKKAFDEALKQAEDYYADVDTAKLLAVFATNMLIQATNDLDGVDTPAVNKDKLKEAIEAAEAVKTTSKYKNATPILQLTFDIALSDAKEVYEDADASAEDVEDKTTLLLKATESLDGVDNPTPAPVDKTELRKEIEKANALVGSEKFNHAGAEKQNEFTEALAEAVKVEADDAAVKSDVDNATARLHSAVEAIESVVIPQPEPDPQPQPQPQPEVLLPYVPEVAEVVEEEKIEEEEIALSSAKDLLKYNQRTENITKEEDKALVMKLIAKKVTVKEFVREFSEQSVVLFAKHIGDVFKEEKAESWYAKDLAIATLTDMVKGYEDGTFRPENHVTGKEFVTMLVRAAGLKVAEKKETEDWFAPYEKAAKEAKLLDDLNIELSKNLTREEVAVLSYKFKNMDRKTAVLPNTVLKVKDSNEISTKYRDAVTYLYEKEVLTGYEDGTYRPQNEVKRSEVVAILHRLLKK